MLISLAVISILYAALFSVCCATVLRSPKATLGKNKDNILCIAGGGLLAMFILQLAITRNMPGHLQDTDLFRLWASFGSDRAIWECYTAGDYVDYPPVYLYVLYIIGFVAKIFRIPTDGKTFIVLVRSVPILFDGITSICVYWFSKEFVGDKKALVLAIFSALNPLNFLNSTMWGQIDSVTGLMVAAMLIFLYKKQYVRSCVMFAVLILTKPQMIIFSPLMGFVVFFDLVAAWKEPVERKKMLKQIGLSVLAVLAVFLIVPLPITGGNYGLLLKKYTEAVGMYQYATLNAANFYGMMGSNWVKNSELLLFFSYKTWGFIFIVLISLIVGIVSCLCKDRRKIFYLGVFTVMGIFMLAHSMHERYLHPMFLLMLIIYVLAEDKKTLFLYGGFSVTAFINCGIVLYTNQREEFIYGDNPCYQFFVLLSAVQVVMFAAWVLHALRFAWQHKKLLPIKE
ncbi:MAG: hypothetical protein E7403_00305 [Ruminococcaceae bacterium]|nr:hypothetical protein [Oscillospiraceae bacterium]